jgi:hypothetical protein
LRTFASGEWYLAAVTSTTDTNDRKNGIRSVRLRDEDNCAEMRFSKVSGAGTVSFKYASYSNHQNGKIQLEYSTNQGATWISAMDEITVPRTNGVSVALFSTNVTLNITGDVRVRVRKTNTLSSSSVNIDDIEITDFGDIPPTVTVTPAATNVLAGGTVSAGVAAKDSGGGDLGVTAWSPDIAGYTFADGIFSWVADTVGVHTVYFASGEDGNGLATTNTLSITVNLPSPSAPSATTTPGSIHLTWDPVPGATGYTVQAYKLATEVELFEEDFSGCVVSGQTSPTTLGVAANSAITDFSSVGLDGWSGFSVYCAYASNIVNNVTNNMVKFGTGSTNGWLQTPPIDLSANGGECTLTLRAGRWGNDVNVSFDVLHITGGGQTTNVLDTIGLSGAAMSRYTVAVTGGTATSVICFRAQPMGNKRFFLDDVRLFYVAEGRFEVPGSQIVISGTTARVFGLPEYSEYLCTVTALGGGQEAVSPEVTARTTAATVIIFR